MNARRCDNDLHLILVVLDFVEVVLDQVLNVLKLSVALPVADYDQFFLGSRLVHSLF